MRTAFPLILGLLLTASPAAAQVERYELGQRLKRFEAEWEEQTDPAARKRALAIVSKASTQFLSFQLGEAARTLDEAWFALRSADPPSDAERWLAALCVVPRGGWSIPRRKNSGSRSGRSTRSGRVRRRGGGAGSHRLRAASRSRFRSASSR